MTRSSNHERRDTAAFKFINPTPISPTTHTKKLYQPIRKNFINPYEKKLYPMIWQFSQIALSINNKD